MAMSAQKGHLAGLITQTLKINGNAKFCSHSAAADDKDSSDTTKEVNAVRGEQRSQTAAAYKRRRRTREASQLPSASAQPSYRLEPVKKFDSALVSKVIQEVLLDLLEGKDYDAAAATAVTQAVCDEIKARVKKLSFDRYKLVVVAVLGQKQRQGLHVVSRCSWDNHFDNYASATHATLLTYCTATVYGIYHD